MILVSQRNPPRAIFWGCEIKNGRLRAEIGFIAANTQLGYVDVCSKKKCYRVGIPPEAVKNNFSSKGQLLSLRILRETDIIQ